MSTNFGFYFKDIFAQARKVFKKLQVSVKNACFIYGVNEF